MVVQLVKSLKPKRLKPKEVRLRILNELRTEGRLIAKELDKTTRTWQGAKPKFEALIGLTGKDATIVIGPTGSDLAVNKWIWADLGTKAHPIVAKNKPTLAFRTQFTPKTKPNIISSFKGSIGGPWTFPKKIPRHPGTKPRNFSKVIVKRRRKPFTNRIIVAARI